MCRSSSTSVSAILAAFLLAAPATTHANIGAPSLAGEPAAEAHGDFASLEILREELRFDLRPLARRERARVQVRYRIRNPGAERSVEMAFITPGVESGGVRLDGRRLAHREHAASRPAEQGAVPRAQLLFAAPLGARREHTIEVEYRIRPHGDTAGRLYWRHGILYDLSPARQWGKFGTLEVEVLLPPDWVATSDPPLSRQGDRLHRSFEGIPAANLVLSASRKEEYTWGWLLVLLGALGGIAVGLTLSWRSGRRSARAPGAVIRALGHALLGGALPIVLASLGLLLWSALLDSHQASGRELYGYTLGLVVLGVPGGILMLIVNAATFIVARRRG